MTTTAGVMVLRPDACSALVLSLAGFLTSLSCEKNRYSGNSISQTVAMQAALQQSNQKGSDALNARSNRSAGRSSAGRYSHGLADRYADGLNAAGRNNRVEGAVSGGLRPWVVSSRSTNGGPGPGSGILAGCLGSRTLSMKGRGECL